MMKRTLVATILLLGLSCAGLASAQARQTVSNQPIMIGADDGEATNVGFALRGRAEVTQGTNRLRANTIDGVSSNGAVSRVTASGDVYYVTPNETIRGDSAIYSVDAATIVVTGDVILTQGRNVLTGRRLTYNIDTGQARMDGGDNGRIRGVFFPEGAN